MTVPYFCKDCKWYDNQHESLGDIRKHYGYCRKHKPIPMLIKDKYYGTWPIVNILDLCGEYRGEE